MLKLLFALSLTVSAVVTVVAQNAPTDAAPRAGEWRYQIKMSGGPMGNHEHTANVCIAQAQLDAGFEQALLRAAPEPKSNGRGRMGTGPKCEYADVQRASPGRSGAVAICNGPMGEVEGPVAVQYGPETFDAEQTMDINGPFGAMRMTRTVSARRLGPCK
jgi:Protein of unknown function (DUF3617)